MIAVSSNGAATARLCTRSNTTITAVSSPCATKRALSRRPASAVASLSDPASSSTQLTAQQPRLKRVMPLISESIAVAAQTQRFEQLAGRSAMMGVLVAVVAELATEHSIFVPFTPETTALLSSVFLGAISLAAAAAVASKRRMGYELLEAVVTSLTANQRSAASITGRQVDTAVDSILNKAFDQGVIYSILAEEENI